MGALAYAIQLLTALPQLLAAGQQVVGMIQASTEALKKMQAEGRDPTPEEWDALNKLIDDLRKDLHS